MRRILSYLLMCSLLAPSIAQAQSPAEAVAIQAKEQFKAGNFEAAAKLFMQAYAKSHTPALLYNAARAYEEAGKKGDALSLFRLYITLSADVDGILDARQRIAKLEAPEPAKPAAPQVKPVPVVVVVPAAPKLAQPQPANTAAWATSGSAVVALGVGVALMADGASGTQKYTGTNPAKFDSARTEWFIGAGLVGVGAALGGLSAYLWTKPVTVTPMPKGVALTVKF